MKATGPFLASRHPLTFGMLPVFWLMPRMTVNLAAFNLAATVYMFIGSLHEEKRLRTAYGNAYQDYQKSGTGFFVSPISHFLNRSSSARHMKTNKKEAE
jgi:protein-S-isoprenylcysteine O-methyltransferase Ste14